MTTSPPEAAAAPRGPGGGGGAPRGHDDAVVAAVLDIVRAGADGADTEAADNFARAALRRRSLEDLRALDPAATAAFLLDAFRFVDRRHPGELALRLDEIDDRAIVEVNVEDGPFLLSTLTEEIARQGYEVVDTLHPVLGVERGDDGRISAIVPARHAGARETWMRLTLDRPIPAAERANVESCLRRVLEDAQSCSRDFRAMLDQVEEIAFDVRASAGSRYPLADVDEAIAFLDWLRDDHFVLLGYRSYQLEDRPDGRYGRVVPGSGLGLLADTAGSSWADGRRLDEVPPALRARLEGGDLLIVSLTNRRSTVHRQERMLYVGVKQVAGDGLIVGEHRIVGLFAQKAYAEPASTIPVLRRKLQAILEAEDVVDHSYDERILRGLFEAIPKAELFRTAVADLRRLLVGLLESSRRQVVRLVAQPNPDRRAVTALVSVPRERFTASFRMAAQSALAERWGATTVDYHLSMTERQALLHFVLHPATDATLEEVDAFALEELERELVALSQTWHDAVAAALTERVGAEAAEALHSWVAALPTAYADTTAVDDALADVDALAGLTAGGDLRITVTPEVRAESASVARVKLYKRGTLIELSDVVPILEGLGLVVVEDVPHHLQHQGLEHSIHDIGVRPRADAAGLDPQRDGPRVADAVLATWRGRAEPDWLNRLVLVAGLTWEQVAVLRAYRRYRRQVGTSFTEAYQNDALVQHPHVARALIDLFEAKFDPARMASADDVESARQRVLEGCDAVQRLDQDRILRGFLGVVDATLRTNAYRAGRRSLALKLDSAAVPDMPKPVPYREIFVYAPDVEGVHLRGGPVARGGLRWSDRLEDFRTEVLGLMKAQMVKNAVIVPTGSKGGFVLKRPPADALALRADVQRQYEVFVRGLLDVTDDVVSDGPGRERVVPPPSVRRHDGDDPYLVVAADRGTATFSDVANAISAEYGFWLGDAFASGGSQGYDHKAMGITARGAWVAVQRHFRELDIDVQNESVTVVGIGDMSGDVFGNGLLRSRAVKLVGAFDHRHVLVDPDPDPERSFAERQRLYDLPGSSWADYDPAVLSEGALIAPRSAKSVELSPQVRALLRVEAQALSPPEVIRALLRAPVDLLFAGGIGTFVKASTETHADVGDRANDAIRIDADQLGARVVGEGGNLGVTQRGRVQYARRGGRINTDAVDNVAGVDTSDHEVNLKILLRAAIDAAALPAEERDALLAEVTDDVAAAVLRDVDLQTAVLSAELTWSAAALEPYESLMVDLERSGRLDRGVEALPTAAELQERQASGAGLTRPELAVLLGYAKVDVADTLLQGTLVDQPVFADVLAAYFPPSIAEAFRDLLGTHRLRRELVATGLANDVVNRMGLTWPTRTARELGVSVEHVVGAWSVARAVADADGRWQDVDSLSSAATPPLELELTNEIDRLVDAYARAYVRQGGYHDVAAAIASDRPAFVQLEQMVSAATADRGGPALARAERWVDLGIPEGLAARMSALAGLALVPDVAAVARGSGRSVADVGAVFLRTAQLLPLDVLHGRIQQLTPRGQWQRWHVRGLVDELRELRRRAAERALGGFPALPGADAASRYLDQRRPALERVQTVLSRLEREPDAGLDGIAVAIRVLRGAIDA